jgi:hypothetical protein
LTGISSLICAEFNTDENLGKSYPTVGFASDLGDGVKVCKLAIEGKWEIPGKLEIEGNFSFVVVIFGLMGLEVTRLEIDSGAGDCNGAGFSTNDDFANFLNSWDFSLNDSEHGIGDTDNVVSRFVDVDGE